MNQDTAFTVSQLSKKYIIGAQKDGSLRGTLAGMIGSKSTKQQEEFWALSDVSFEIKKGEVIGIIGKNGAGKSTLLKILSQITKPTTGRIEINGRVASLLEVGTGFHPELTGRENIYLNGTILGMTRKEVKEKFDEIVEFSGVQKFIDTPVKHYSSGMYVRLAFAVAAHLEPEILIIDEVLAVGDAEFQKKCLGKMKEVAGQGRTVIFVSHNLASVKSLCSRAILLKAGKLLMEDNVNKVLNAYLSDGTDKLSFREINLEKEGFIIKSTEVFAKNKLHNEPIDRLDILNVAIDFENQSKASMSFTLKFKGDDGVVFMTTNSSYNGSELEKGLRRLIFEIPGTFLNEGSFSMDLLLVRDRRTVLILENDALQFHVNPEIKPIGSWMGKESCYIKPMLKTFYA